ncbi:MAG: hypothetical protein JWP63_3256 [Candidatus Solibacter sp.]|nr:hypothetical protein [Candidatus Solibacter sp.]
MHAWLRSHPVLTAVLWTALALAILESALLYYYLSSWITLPFL